MGRVDGKVAIITGGAGGIGAATARLLAGEGAKVTITDVAVEAGEDMAAEIGGHFMRHDVTQAEEWQAVIEEVERRNGALHVLVNGAGIEGDLAAGTPESVSLEEWRRVHAINLDGTLLGCQTALPAIRRAGGGAIINVSSMVAYFATPFSAAYGSSKAAVMQLTKSVALHAAKGATPVRCNSVHPGLIRTRMLETIMKRRAQMQNMAYEEVAAATADELALGRLGAPEDVAKTILFLASEDAEYITGGEFRVDGGWRLGAR